MNDEHTVNLGGQIVFVSRVELKRDSANVFDSNFTDYDACVTIPGNFDDSEKYIYGTLIFVKDV